MGSRGLSSHLLDFIKGRVFRRLHAIDGVLGGDRYASDSHGRKRTGLWAQIHENRQVLALLQEQVPDLLAAHPEIETSFAHRDAFLHDLADAADVVNPWAISEPDGWPRPWPGAEPAPELRDDAVAMA